jgi:serine/threonine protein kinase
MERAAGVELSKLTLPVDLHSAILIIKSFLQAIEYLHLNGVCHRDLKPENIFVCDTKVTLIDFNVAVRFNQVDV